MMEVTPNEALRHMIDLLSPESQYVAYHALDALEAELAEANEMRLAEANEMRLADLEAELAAAQEDARLQRALDRIEKAGCVPNLGYSVEYGGIFEVEVTVRAFGPPGDEWRLGEEHLFCAFSDAEAAEQAADWAESQKEGKA